MAKNKQVTTQDIKDAQEKSKAQEAQMIDKDKTHGDTEASVAAEQAQAQTPETPATAEQKPAEQKPAETPKKEASPAKMAHGAVQDKGNPPTEALPDGWQYVWHDPYTYDGKNGPITVRGHWEKAKKSPPKPKAAEKKPEALAAGTEAPKDQAPAESGSSQSEQK